MTKPKINVKVNDKGYYAIEKKDEWWMLKPKTSPSGLHIIIVDKKQHHYDLYDEEGHKLDKEPIELKGYSEAGYIYVSSGQNVFEIDPESKPKLIPTFDKSSINAFPSGAKTVIQSNAPGWVIEIHKQNDDK